MPNKKEAKDRTRDQQIAGPHKFFTADDLTSISSLLHTFFLLINNDNVEFCLYVFFLGINYLSKYLALLKF